MINLRNFIFTLKYIYNIYINIIIKVYEFYFIYTIIIFKNYKNLNR